MQRGGNDSSSGGLGPNLVGEKITVNKRNVSVVRQLGEGGFSFVYLVKDISDSDLNTSSTAQSNSRNNSNTSNHTDSNNHIVLKITSIHSRIQRDIAEKEAKLLSRLSHPSIVRIMDSCYRSIPNSVNENGGKSHPMKLANIVGGGGNSSSSSNNGHRPQHLILMEYCEGGTALSVCNTMKANNQRFDLPSLIIVFGQICNAVSYLHAQRPPIVHRDLKPVNFLVKNGAYKLCDFGSAIFGHVDLRTPRARAEAEEVIQKTTTQMFRSPEMVDLYMSNKLTQSTDVWALGCCLYSLAFFQNCFEEGSNLAILSRNYKIPDDNPYGDDLAELLDRMLTTNCKDRADMTEVILCLSAIYSKKPLPPRKTSVKAKIHPGESEETEGKERVGVYRTDGQGIRDSVKSIEKKPVEAKKLNPNSAAARRKNAAKNQLNTSTDSGITRLNSSSLSPSRRLDQTMNSEFGSFSIFSSEQLGDFSGSDAALTNTWRSRLDGDFGAKKQSSFSSSDELSNIKADSFEDGKSFMPFPADLEEFGSFGLNDSNSDYEKREDKGKKKQGKGIKKLFFMKHDKTVENEI